MLVLGGSDGGIPSHLAATPASEGFTCLALAYFGTAGLPRRLAEIPLEYVEAALRWLGEQPLVAGPRVGVIGASRGAELALLAAASFPDRIGAVIAYAPSSVVFAGIDLRGHARRCSAWSHGGEPVAFVPYAAGSRPSLSRRGLSVAPMYRTALENDDAVAAATIPVERTRAPVLLVSGDQDAMWPSSQMGEMVKARLARLGRGDQVVHLRYPKAGHALAPRAPSGARSRIMSRLYDLGGQPRDNREAALDAWPKAVSFFRTHLE